MKRSPSGLPNIKYREGAKTEGLAIEAPTKYLRTLDDYYGENYRKEELNANISGEETEVTTFLLRKDRPLEEGRVDPGIIRKTEEESRQH